MAIILKANYSKKLGLPDYSSHSYSLTLEAEISDVENVPAESERLYNLLQSAVDRELEQVGFVPEPGYGMRSTPAPPSSNGIHSPTNRGHGTRNGNSSSARAARTSGINNRRSSVSNARCTDKQRDFIDKIIKDYSLTNGEVEATANTLFGITDISKLNKLEASGLIDELLSLYGEKPPEGVQLGNGRHHQNGGAR